MVESIPVSLGRWRYGMHPQATEMRIRTIGRVNLLLGEALRLEMSNADGGPDDVVHLQYYIVTDAGPWALWLTCAPEDAAESETSLQELAPPFSDEGQPSPKGGRPALSALARVIRPPREG
jgi:hypothetical protein